MIVFRLHGVRLTQKRPLYDCAHLPMYKFFPIDRVGAEHFSHVRSLLSNRPFVLLIIREKIPTRPKKNLLMTQATVTVPFSLTSPLTTTDSVILRYNRDNIIIQNPCTSTQGFCIHFPQISWTFFQPTAPILPGAASITVTMDNAIYFDRIGKHN